jgi:anion-transporting  ArsA/GET3 family ATPase
VTRSHGTGAPAHAPIGVLDAPAHDDARTALDKIVRERRIIICVGSGGVGKTTTAAALALYAAHAGRRALVITIDPARRLANALGLDALAHAPQRIDDAVLKEAGMPLRAPLSAMMLDLKAAWDDMLFRTAPDEATAKKILENRFYDALSRDLPGAHEFIACEQLHHLAQGERFDLVVLDTPPTQNALDFLEAPARILNVLDNEAFRFFANRKQSLGLGFLEGAAGRAQSVLARFAGAEMLEQLGDFIVLLRDLFDPLTKRARELTALLRGDATRFVVVTSPLAAALSEARFFVEELGRRELHLGAVVANRVTRDPGPALTALQSDRVDDMIDAAGVTGDVGVKLAAILDEAVREEANIAARENKAVEQLIAHAPVPVVRVPRMTEAVHDAARLAAIVPWLVGPRA